MIARLRIVLAAFAGWLLGPADPHQCLLCRAVTPRLTGSQRAQISAGLEASCPWCNGPVWSEEFLAACRAPGGADRLLTDLTSTTAAPGCAPGRPTEQAVYLKGSTAMDSIPREAHELRPGDVIVAHPDHPDQRVWYRVTTWPRRITAASVMVDYTARPDQPDGDASGVLVLDVDQQCEVQPAHAQGGAA